MKALSIQQPWAQLYLEDKNVENRTWYTSYRGPLLIHAGKRRDNQVWNSELQRPPYNVLGALIGLVEIINCTRDRPPNSVWHEDGQFGLYRAPNPLMFITPIRYRGQLGIFDVPDDIVAEAIGQTISINNLDRAHAAGAEEEQT